MSLGKKICLAVWLTVMTRICFSADFIQADYFGTALFLRKDTVVESNVIVSVTDINVKESLRIINRGYVNGRMNVCKDCDLYIENTGTFDGDIYVADGGQVVQVIHDVSGVGTLDVHGKYNILVDGAKDFMWRDLYNSDMRADVIVLRDSCLRLTDGDLDGYNNGVPIEFQGKVIIDAKDVTQWRDKVLFTNIIGDGNIVVQAVSHNPLYVARASIENGKAILQEVRETDYYKILGNNQGTFLNMVRMLNPSDVTLTRLDNATTLPDLYRIMSKSVILNPGNLMRGVQTIDVLLADADFGINDVGADGGVCSSSGRIISNEFEAYVTNVIGRLRLSDDLRLVVSAHAGSMDISGYDWGTAPVYGAGVSIDYITDAILARAYVVGSYAKFYLPYVYDGKSVAQNPNGFSLYSGTDMGRAFCFSDNWRMIPFLGVEYERYSILHQSDADVHMRTGAEIDYHSRVADIAYEYGGRVTLNDAGRAMLSGSIGFLSPDDAVGGNIGLAILREGDRIAWKLSLSGKYVF